MIRIQWAYKKGKNEKVIRTCIEGKNCQGNYLTAISSTNLKEKLEQNKEQEKKVDDSFLYGRKLNDEENVRIKSEKFLDYKIPKKIERTKLHRWSRLFNAMKNFKTLDVSIFYFLKK